MKQAIIRIRILAIVIVLAAALPARAATTIYTIQDVGTFLSFYDFTTSDTFAGRTGFVGILPTFPTDLGYGGPAFVHQFGLEYYKFGNISEPNGIYSEVEMQVDTSGLSGATITSAVLSYTLLGFGNIVQTVTATSYTANGVLGFNMTPPDNLGSVQFTSTGLSANSVDVTTLLQNSVAANNSWFGLYLTPNGPGINGQFTYTSGAYPGSYGDNPDSADVRLTVTYAVPEPTTLALAGLGGVEVLLVRLMRRRKICSGDC